MVVYKVRHRMQSTMSKKDRDITVSLIFVSAAFFVNMTITCVSLLLVFNNRSIDLSTRNLLNWVKEMPLSINNSINFFIYFASSQSFRNEFLQMIRLKPKLASQASVNRKRRGTNTASSN
ncbi:uncharacterized protein LOC142352882 [Convolutriloba macropyga]|uniref:uncharacterized protein LOC142352882 n=1 Tax=Convolutriloba macropyga TaxID=536237 RepID=UPI003F51C55C